VEFLVGEPLERELDALRRTQPEPEEPAALASGLFAELRGEMEAVEPEVQAEA
jgi:hypothetical protein